MDVTRSGDGCAEVLLTGEGSVRIRILLSGDNQNLTDAQRRQAAKTATAQADAAAQYLRDRLNDTPRT